MQMSSWQSSRVSALSASAWRDVGGRIGLEQGEEATKFL